MSEARIRANRENAKKSTGPKSQAGKARSSKNATTHGLTAAGAGIASPVETEALSALLRSEFHNLETSAAQDIAREMLHAGQIKARRRQVIGDCLLEAPQAMRRSPPQTPEKRSTTSLLELPRLADYERKSASRLRTLLKAAAREAATRDTSMTLRADFGETNPIGPGAVFTGAEGLAKRTQSLPLPPGPTQLLPDAAAAGETLSQQMGRTARQIN